MKLFISGGHLTPALSFIDYASQEEELKVTFFGRKFSQDSNKQLAREAEEIQKRNFEFVYLDVPRFSGFNPILLLVSAIKYKFAILKVIWQILKSRPDAFVSFGGYLAVPIAIACYLMRVKIITHEQTIVAGSANIFISKLSTKTAISFPQSKKYFDKKKVVITGNPIRANLIDENLAQPSWLKGHQSKPIMFVTGGNQGSFIINNTVMQLLPQLTRKFVVIHSCGKSTEKFNYKNELNKAKRKLSANQKNNYFVREWITENDLGWILKHSDLAISRAGANTIQELIISQLPAILIPLPFSNHDEQNKNAQNVAKIGGAVLINQKSLNPEKLLDKISYVYKHKKSMSAALAEISVPKDGAEKLFALTKEVINQ